MSSRKGTSEDTAKTVMACDEREMKADILPKGETRTNFKNPMHLGACFSLLFEYCFPIKGGHPAYALVAKRPGHVKQPCCK